MRVRIWTAALTVLAAVTAAIAAAPVQGAAGLYTKEQATRGENVYVHECSECHDGGIMGPELWGRDFIAQWDGKPVRKLLTTIKETMPAESPGSLNERDLYDVVAFVLSENGQPAGETPLAASAPLDTIITKGTK